MGLIFESARKYSRSDIGELLGLGKKAKGGIWVSGIIEHQGEFIIFPNVGAAGTFGDDFGNRWEGRCLRWYHKKNSHRDWPSVRRLLDAGRAHVFWRSSNQDLFEYAGNGAIAEVSGSSPVGILWSFDDAASEGASPKSLRTGASQPGRAPVPSHQFQVGDRVRHSSLGVGRVLAITGGDMDASATVYFAGLEERKQVSLVDVEKMAGFGPG